MLPDLSGPVNKFCIVRWSVEDAGSPAGILCALASNPPRLISNLLISVDPPAVLGKPEWHYELTLTLLEAPSSIVMDIMVMASSPASGLRLLVTPTTNILVTRASGLRRFSSHERATNKQLETWFTEKKKHDRF